MKTFLAAVLLGLVAAVAFAQAPDTTIRSEDKTVEIVIIPKSFTYFAESKWKQVEGQIILINTGMKGQFKVEVGGCYAGTGHMTLTGEDGKQQGQGTWRMGDNHLYSVLAMNFCQHFLQFIAPPETKTPQGAHQT